MEIGRIDLLGFVYYAKAYCAVGCLGYRKEGCMMATHCDLRNLITQYEAMASDPDIVDKERRSA